MSILCFASLQLPELPEHLSLLFSVHGITLPSCKSQI